LETFGAMNVYEYVKREEAKASKTGKFVGVRWVDSMKEGAVKSRLVAQEFAGNESRDDIFAGTPPLAATRFLISEVASKFVVGNKCYKLMVLDVKRAFLYGEIEEEIFIDLPNEDKMKQAGYVGRLRKAMYGTRSAPQVWQKLVSSVMSKLGFVACRVSPCVFYHKERDLRVVTHVDDFLVGGEKGELKWFQKEIKKEFDIKAAILGDEYDEQKEVQFLGRRLTWTRGGIRYEADPKHVETLLREWDMKDAKAVSTPGVNEDKYKQDDEKELSKTEGTRYRRAVARINYLALDRPDIGFASKELSRSMSKPTEIDVVKLKRLLRYLKGSPRMTIFYKWQSNIDEIKGFTDSDWAGCQKTRRSTSGGVLVRGAHLLLHWSSTQATVALSSGEAELNSIVKIMSELLGVLNMCKEMGLKKTGKVFTDSSAANGIAHRLGCGKVKHLEARQLWVQEVVQSRRATVEKVERKYNPADALTHNYLAHEGQVHFGRIGVSRLGVGDGVAGGELYHAVSPASMYRACVPRGGVSSPLVSQLFHL